MTTTTLALLFALVLQGIIPLVLLWVLGAIRLPLVAKNKIRVADIALSREPWPEHEKRVSNAYDSQFQLPLLFYLAGGILLYLGPNWFEALLAFLFVVSRVAHAAIFAIDNHVGRRFVAFMVGYVALIALWLDMLARLFLIALSPS